MAEIPIRCFAASIVLLRKIETGRERRERTGLNWAPSCSFFHAGDELVVLQLYRLGRPSRDVLNVVHELDEKIP